MGRKQTNSKKSVKPSSKVKVEVDKKRLHTILKSSYQDNKNAEVSLKEKGYTLDKELSGQRAKVFTDPHGRPHVVYRGTQNKHDVMTDVALMLSLGKYTSRVKHTKKVHKQVEKKYGQPVNTYGHSLGGYLAENAGAKGEVVTFNKASAGDKKKNLNQFDVRTHNDVVSLMTPKGGTRQLTIKGAFNPLTSHSVDSLLT